MVDQVQDKRAEFGINIGVIIQGLILLSTAGFGTFLVDGIGSLNVSVKSLTAVIAAANTRIELNVSEINHVKIRAEEVKIRVEENRDMIHENRRMIAER